MFKKLKTRRGMTIAEMLVAVALLALLTAGGIVAAAGVMASYRHMKDVANADILASTVIEALSNEVRLGRDIQDPGTAPDNGRLELDSAFFGEGTTLTLDTTSGKRLVAQTTDASGTITEHQLLSENTYNGLQLDDLGFTMDSASGRPVYTIAFTVRDDAGTALWSDSAAASSLQ